MANAQDQLPTNIPIVDNEGLPTPAFIFYLIKMFKTLSTGAKSLVSLRNDITALQALSQQVITTSINYSVSKGNYSVMTNATTAPIVITLPLANTAKALIIGVTKTDATANSVTIIRSGADLICGNVSQTLLYQNEALNFISDGINWQLAN